MLKEFYEFDRNMIHEKYQSVVEKFENRLFVWSHLFQATAGFT
jgi:hypothetical protein